MSKAIPIQVMNSKLKMHKMFSYLHVFVVIMDQISAVNKDFSQPILTQSKAFWTYNYSIKHVRSNVLCSLYLQTPVNIIGKQLLVSTLGDLMH